MKAGSLLAITYSAHKNGSGADVGLDPAHAHVTHTLGGMLAEGQELEEGQGVVGHLPWEEEGVVGHPPLEEVGVAGHLPQEEEGVAGQG